MLSQAVVIDKKSYWVIKQALSQEVCALLASYAQLKASSKPQRRKSADPLKDIHREYGDAMMETLLAQFTPLVEQATGLALWPTLSFYYTYKKGNRLNPHKDRSSCQIVAGLCIGVDDAYQQSKGMWPLILQVDGKPKSVALDVGDLVIFKGHETAHWREPFTGAWFVSAIFGYVDKKGPFAFQKYDQRKALGKPHVGMFYWLWGCMKEKITRRFLSRG